MNSTPNFRGGIDEFFTNLLEVESRISPSLFAWYCDNLDKRAIKYIDTEAPGRLIRDYSTGEPVFREMTVREFFAALGVLEFFDASDPNCLVQMQYRSTNAWGFVGYQFGEALLRSVGYYEPTRAEVTMPDGTSATFASWYLGHLEPWRWARGVREILVDDPASGTRILASDTNRWLGDFTGLDDIHSFEELLHPSGQEKVIRRTLRVGLAQVRQTIQDRGLTWRDVDRMVFQFQGVTCRVSLSGILAAIHLRGSDATSRFLIEGTTSEDELGTSILRYLHAFAGYDVQEL